MAVIYIFLCEWVYSVTTCLLSAMSALACKSPDEYIVLQRALLFSERGCRWSEVVLCDSELCIVRVWTVEWYL
jgi:hypothetical protein